MTKDGITLDSYFEITCVAKSYARTGGAVSFAPEELGRYSKKIMPQRVGVNTPIKSLIRVDKTTLDKLLSIAEDERDYYESIMKSRAMRDPKDYKVQAEIVGIRLVSDFDIKGMTKKLPHPGIDYALLEKVQKAGLPKYP